VLKVRDFSYIEFEVVFGQLLSEARKEVVNSLGHMSEIQPSSVLIPVIISLLNESYAALLINS
jgi:hypothetical protein